MAALFLLAPATVMIADDPAPTRAAHRRPWVELAPPARPVEGRRFRDRESVWTVVEITSGFLVQSRLPLDAMAPELREGWLSFENETERRRLAPIPGRWYELPAHKLQALCEGATHVGRPWGPTRQPPGNR
ncbi:MAG TPA: hypothetical protein VMM18_05310 [Gemmatimonadaceae bacterium]|nr:hypothetical protein [Gemmatimonadaceae bacterium]